MTANLKLSDLGTSQSQRIAFTLTGIKAFLMTHHVEAVTLLTR